MLDSTPPADPEPSAGPSTILGTEVAPAASPDTAPDTLLDDQMEPGGPDDSPKVYTVTLTQG